MKRLGHLAIIILFLTVLYVPLVLSIVLEDKEISESEKRRLAGLPSLEWSLESLARFPDLFETYYNDHFGLREELVELYNYLYFKVLRKSPLPTVTVGRDEWLFYNAEGVLDDFLGLTTYSEEQLEAWKRILVDRQEWLNGLSIRYLFAVAPTKMMIYPEQLPERVQRQAGTPILARLSEYLARHADLDGYLDLRPDLLAAKARRQVYFRTDTHWNPDGAFDAYTSIMREVQSWFPAVKILGEDSLHKTPLSQRGDICITLNLNSIAPEQTVMTVVEPSCAAKTYERLDLDIRPGGDEAKNPDYLPVQNGCPDASLTALVIHDSFGLFLRPYFNETFKKVVYSNYIDLKDLKELIARERFDLIIDVRVARHLAGMLEPDPELERAILEQHAARSPDVRLRVDGQHGQEGLGATNELELRRMTDGLLLRAAGSDPYLLLNFDAETGGEPLLVQLSLNSPRDTELQFFYTTPESTDFSPQQQIRKKIKEGENELLFRLPHPRTSGRLRLDPGMVPGDYLLRSLVIVQERRPSQQEVFP
ncbi:MAG: alginate O-acetyltransferase AlgX-related protein [Desulfobulbaceae bacterium]